MPKLPPSVIRALRADEPGAPDPERVTRLAESIDLAALPLLAARRRTPPSWWELPAAWAATLIPASLVLAMASLFVLWRIAPPRPDPAQEIAQASVDQVVNELVTAPPR
jgi:hypothetical protein